MNSESSVLIRPLNQSDLASVRRLCAVASSEGFRFLRRFVTELEHDRVRLDAPDEFFLCAICDSGIVGVGGVTPDPYIDDSRVGRIRHVYVHPEWRGIQIGHSLLREIENRATRVYAILRLRTDTEPAARFYEMLGYRTIRSPSATHFRLSPENS